MTPAEFIAKWRAAELKERSQLGTHYTDRDKIMLIVEPVVLRPLLAEWREAKEEIDRCLGRMAAAKTSRAQTRQQALEVFQKQSGTGFVDCLIVEIASKAGHQPLGTFDRLMSKLPSAVNVVSAK